MGFFDELKKAAGGVKDGFAQAGEAFSAAKQGLQDAAAAQKEQADAQRELAAQTMRIIDPTPQDEIDRINAGDGPGRAVVLGNQNQLEEGESVWRTEVILFVRMRLADGQLGPEQRTKLWTDSGTIRALTVGTEIPMQYDRATGLVVAKPDAKAIAAELKDRKKKGGRGF